MDSSPASLFSLNLDLGLLKFSELMKKHEFSVTPKSLFDPEGLPLQCTDKACFMKGLEELLKKENTAGERSAVIAVDSDEEISTVIAIDCMGIVNQLKIGRGTKTVSDLADQFVLKVITESSGYGTVILVFDNYGDESEISLLLKPRPG